MKPRGVAALVLPLALAACTTGWDRQGVPTPDTLPEAFVGEPGPSLSAVADRWWESFESAELNGAVESALDDNLTIQAALARVRQADALAAQTRSGLFPSVDASAAAGRSRQRVPPSGAAQSNQFSVSLDAAYEADVWGRVSAGRAASLLDAEAARLDADAARVSVAAQVVEAWLDGAYARARRVLLEGQRATQQQLLEVVTLRLTAARSTALDIEQQRQQVQALDGQLALVDASEATAALRLGALQGRATAESGVALLPTLPPAPTVGVPADLLERRPDVAAARVRADAADARAAQAIADRLPALRLSGSVFLQSTSLSELVDQVLWSLVGSITAPIFDGGRRRAEVERTLAAFDTAVLTYAQTLVDAVVEVETALALEQGQRAFVAELEAQVATSGRALDLARDQYREGVIDYLRVVTAVTAQQRAEQSLLDAQRQLLSYRVQLHRALGGGWFSPSETSP